MLTIVNGRERTLEQFERLLGRVDGRLKIRRVFEPSGSILGVIEIELES